jgi:hypothetical protein
MVGFVKNSVKFIGASAKVSSFIFSVQQSLCLQNGIKL